jgi:hypothetical protein
MDDERKLTPEETINIGGPGGVTVFSHLSIGDVEPQSLQAQLQSKIDGILAPAMTSQDDRLLVLLGALVIENAIDDLLASLMPGYKTLRARRDYTLSMRIEIATALRLIPSRILSDADFVRKVRNKFVHDLSFDTFNSLSPSEIQSMRDRVREYNPKPFGTPPELFRTLVRFAATALYAYTFSVKRLAGFLRSPQLAQHLRASEV